MNESDLNLEEVATFESAANDTAVLTRLASHILKCKDAKIPVFPNAMTIAKIRAQMGDCWVANRAGRVYRRDDWMLEGFSPEHDARVALMVTRWANEPKLIVGLRFINELILPSAASLNYMRVWTVVQQSMENMKAGKYQCGRCFDTKKIVSLGDGCCGSDSCSDIVNAEPKHCPACSASQDE